MQMAALRLLCDCDINHFHYMKCQMFLKIFRNGNFCITMPLGKVESFEMQCNFVVSFKTWNEIAGSSSVSCKATAFKT